MLPAHLSSRTAACTLSAGWVFCLQFSFTFTGCPEGLLTRLAARAEENQITFAFRAPQPGDRRSTWSGCRSTQNSEHGWSGTRLGFWANCIVGLEEVWGCWWRCVGQLDAFWAFKNSQGGEILGTATKSHGLRTYGEPSPRGFVPFARRRACSARRARTSGLLG